MNKYFAASNSAKGFCSYYDECFGNAQKIYIIKGGPGTGKSGFMKRVSDRAEGKGYFTEYFYCSSDPDSLDGVLVHNGEKSIVLLDGTAPHSYDMVYPGVRDNIINLGDAWDERILDVSRNKIFELCEKKTHEYRKAYNALASCGNLSAVIDSYISGLLNVDKLNSVAKKLVERFDLHGEGDVKLRLIDSVSMKGRVRFSTFEDNANTCVIVGDTYGTGHMMLASIKNFLELNKCDYHLSYDPVIPWKINGIFERGKRVAFILSDSRAKLCGDEEGLHHINMKRFIEEPQANIKGELKYTFALYKDSLNLAGKYLSGAAECHFALEEIYKNAMDFDIVNQKIESFCDRAL